MIQGSSRVNILEYIEHAVDTIRTTGGVPSIDFECGFIKCVSFKNESFHCINVHILGKEEI